MRYSDSNYWKKLKIVHCGVVPDLYGRTALAAQDGTRLLLSVSLFQYGSPSENTKFGNTTVIRRFGLVAFLDTSLQEWFSFTSEYLAAETSFPGPLASTIYPTPSRPIMFADSPQSVDRVILIQIESFDPEAIDAEVNGVSIMPFVSSLKEDCLTYTNFFTTKSVGGSADTEFSVATGLLASSKLPSIRHVDFDGLPTLYDWLAGIGVASYFSHNNHIGFYSRNAAYNQLDKVHYRCPRTGEDITEKAFAEETLQQAMQTSKRFFYYFFNYQSHGPYMGYSNETIQDLSITNNFDSLINYYASMYEVDRMIASLFTLQQPDLEAGRSIFIITADHPSQLHTHNDTLKKARIPMLICHRDFQGKEVDKITSAVDLFPTIVSLLGANRSDIPSIGQNMLEDSDNVVLFPSGMMLRRSENQSLVLERCGSACQKFIDYTDQHIRVSQ